MKLMNDGGENLRNRALGEVGGQTAHQKRRASVFQLLRAMWPLAKDSFGLADFKMVPWYILLRYHRSPSSPARAMRIMTDAKNDNDDSDGNHGRPWWDASPRRCLPLPSAERNFAYCQCFNSRLHRNIPGISGAKGERTSTYYSYDATSYRAAATKTIVNSGQRVNKTLFDKFHRPETITGTKSGSEAEEIPAPVFERAGSWFESHSDRFPVRKTNGLTCCGYLKVTKAREMAGQDLPRL
uniref:Uncharacterized protein n=1 Tax=Anopheles culicifacies TaxID=139723 RepID=A0A182M3Z5_9DIPT